MEQNDSIVSPTNDTNKSIFKRELFKKRLNRSNYIIGFLLFAFGFSALFILFLIYLVGPFIKPSYQNPTPSKIIVDVLGVLPIQLLFCLGYFSLITRRAHDLDIDNIWTGNKDFPTWNLFWPWILYFRPGTDGPNKYGPPQKSISILQILGFK